QTETPVHTHRHVHTGTETHVHTQIHVHTQKYTCTYRYTHVHAYTNTHTPPPIKSCSTSLFTHRSGYCTPGGGREHSTHAFLCFHCAQLLSSLTAPSANDRSGPEFRACSARRPWGTHSPPP
ncbi:unnamed protein product, partial [Staurois parvus]